MANIKIGTYNVNGIRNTMKRRKIFHDLHQRQYNVICLQETHSQPQDESIWRSEYGGQVYFSHGTHDSRGVMILSEERAQLGLLKSVQMRMVID